ncbi:MAG: hypothetical protein NDF52_02115 [archaeon YNP-WB-062]|nr:hypothetical protein [Candidatus Culexarchaeum yellowstonense]
MGNQIVTAPFICFMVRVIMKSSLEERVARIEGILEQMDKRLNHIESEIRDLRGRFYWIIGIQITMWVTIILTILFKHA